MNLKNNVYTNHSLSLRKQQINRLKELLFSKKLEQNTKNIPIHQQQTDIYETNIDIKQLSCELAKILESNQEVIEEELRQVAISRNITFDDFKKFQKDFISQLYTNPSHPLDMQVQQLNEIRKDFEEAALRAKDKNSSNEGIPIDVNQQQNIKILQNLFEIIKGFSQILARKMNIDPSRIQKFLQRSAFFNQITWNEFQSMLDKESTIRDELLDWFMHKESPNSLNDQNEYSLEEKIEYDLKPQERTSQRVFIIENLIEMKVDKRNYFLVIFDESTIAIYEGQNFQSALEFVIPYDPSLNAIQEKNRKLKQNIFNNDDNDMGSNKIGSLKNKRQASLNLRNKKDSSSDLSQYNLTIQDKYSKSAKKQNIFENMSLYDDEKIRNFPTESSSSNFYGSNQKRSTTANSRQRRLETKLQKTPIKASIIQEDTFSEINKSYIGQRLFGLKTNTDMSINESFLLQKTKKQANLTNQYNKSGVSKQLNRGGGQQFSSQDRSRSLNQSSQTMNQSFQGIRQEDNQKNTLNQNSILNDSKQNQSYFMSTFYQSQRGELNRTCFDNIGQNQSKQYNQSTSMRVNESTINQNSQTQNFSKIRKDSMMNQQSARKISGDKLLKREEKKEGNNKPNFMFLEDPDLYKIIKIYLTSEIKDEDEKKKVLIPFDEFYSIYKREPYKYIYHGQTLTPKPEISGCKTIITIIDYNFNIFNMK